MAVDTAVKINKQVLNDLLGQVVATDVSLEEYMEIYAADYCEWVEGVVIKMAGSLKHNDLIAYMRQLLMAYFELLPIGRTISQPFVMRLPAFPKRRREPDLLIVLKSNPNKILDTYLDGAADICIEIVSEESVERDHGDKFHEYEKGGVPEYWILDPLRHEPRFYQLDENGRYIRQVEDAAGNYRTAALPGFVLYVPTLWEDNLPGPAATAQAVAQMLNEVS
ncbi:MAG: Uma2 family endonuclease [Chloroflexota bacterium]